jgi:hypothetical protein
VVLQIISVLTEHINITSSILCKLQVSHMVFANSEQKKMV